MEAFSLAATHGGSINHIHTLTVSSEVLKEARTIVSIIVIGWVATVGLRGVFANRSIAAS
jgi:hypothetical protein